MQNPREQQGRALVILAALAELEVLVLEEWVLPGMCCEEHLPD